MDEDVLIIVTINNEVQAVFCCTPEDTDRYVDMLNSIVHDQAHVTYHDHTSTTFLGNLGDLRND